MFKIHLESYSSSNERKQLEFANPGKASEEAFLKAFERSAFKTGMHLMEESRRQVAAVCLSDEKTRAIFCSYMKTMGFPIVESQPLTKIPDFMEINAHGEFDEVTRSMFAAALKKSRDHTSVLELPSPSWNI